MSFLRSGTSGFSAALSPAGPPSGAPFDIILAIGQSNMVGAGAGSTNDGNVSAVKQYPNIASDTGTYRTVRSSITPLYFPENTTANGYHSPAEDFAKAYATRTGNNVLIIPCAWGGTSLVSSEANNASSPPQWIAGNPGGSLYEGAIAQINAAIAADLGTIVAIALIQGESDAIATSPVITTANYLTGINALIAGLRARIAGASSVPFIIGRMMPEFITASGAAVDRAHLRAVLSNSAMGYAQASRGFNADTYHYTAPGLRQIGADMDVALQRVAKPQIRYDFEVDAIGSTVLAATNLCTTGIAPSIVSTSRTGMTGKYLTFTGLTGADGELGAIVFEGVPPTMTDQVVEWTEHNSATTGKSGVTLRAQPTPGVNQLGRDGYCCAVSGTTANNSPSKIDIYKFNSGGFDVVGSSSAIASPSSGVRRYRAAAIGTGISVSYSDDGGATWTLAISGTDGTFTSGQVQYCQGFGTGSAGVVAADQFTIRTAI